MEIDRESPEYNLGCEMLVKMRCLIADVVFVSDRSTEVWEAHGFLELLQPGQGESELHIKTATGFVSI